MAIDRIGSGKSLPPLSLEAPELTRGGLSKPERAAADPVARPEDAARASAVEQVKDGTLTLDSYLEQHVQQATAHLDGGLGAEQLELIRGQLRQQLATDPWVRQLVLEACGQLPVADA